MEQTSSSNVSEEQRLSLKRKRNISENEDSENQPPIKISPKNENTDNEIVEETSDEDSPNTISDQPRSNLNIDEYTCSFLSPPSIPELPNCVLSPLENVARDSTPQSNKRACKWEPQATPKRRCPLPPLTWANSSEVWRQMCKCDAASALSRNPNMFDAHPGLQPRMRAILLDWLNEVCEVYKLHRETFYLTVDYIDRYITHTEDVPKRRLQLIGITCLFIAAKVEEVYPPKISEFAYVTDGACTTDEILLEELHILKVLSWDITPLTINSWLNIYMQLASEPRNVKRWMTPETLRSYTFVFPQYSSLEYVTCGQLVDLAVLHVDVNCFAYSMVAAAAVAHSFSKELAVKVSGYSSEAIEPCWRWMSLVNRVIQESGAPRAGFSEPELARGDHLIEICPSLNVDDGHRLQIHNVTLDMFDKVYQDMQEQCQDGESASESAEHTFPPTPPSSDQKSPKTPSTETPSTRHRDCETE